MNTPHVKPSIKDLGFDLLNLSAFQLITTITLPFIFFLLYFAFAFRNIWIGAVLCTVLLSFFSYGSTSHDLVHENLKLNKTFNAFPYHNDIEGSAARMSFVRSLLEGIIFQAKIYYWSVSNHENYKYHRLIIFEGMMIVTMVVFCIYSLSFTYMYFVYMCLMIAGSWIIPLVTSYVVHAPDNDRELTQTRLFRGAFFSIVAVNHLFHLEHHLYPMVPHKNWSKLARRLDHYFQSQGIEPVKLPL